MLCVVGYDASYSRGASVGEVSWWHVDVEAALRHAHDHNSASGQPHFCSYAWHHTAYAQIALESDPQKCAAFNLAHTYMRCFNVLHALLDDQEAFKKDLSKAPKKEREAKKLIEERQELYLRWIQPRHKGGGRDLTTAVATARGSEHGTGPNRQEQQDEQRPRWLV